MEVWGHSTGQVPHRFASGNEVFAWRTGRFARPGPVGVVEAKLRWTTGSFGFVGSSRGPRCIVFLKQCVFFYHFVEVNFSNSKYNFTHQTVFFSPLI